MLNYTVDTDPKLGQSRIPLQLLARFERAIPRVEQSILTVLRVESKRQKALFVIIQALVIHGDVHEGIGHLLPAARGAVVALEYPENTDLFTYGSTRSW